MTLPRRARRAPAAPVATFVVFTAAGRRFALSTRAVTAVAEAPEVTPLAAPGRPEVLGLVAHRGRALPLFDLGRCLGDAGDEPSGRTHCVVVEQGDRRAAFAVAGLEGLTRIAGDGLPAGCETFEPAAVIFAAASGRAE